MNYYIKSLEMHKIHKGKTSIESKVKIKNIDDLSTAYTPGVAQPCLEIAKNPDEVYTYTNKGNLVAIISDGSAVLGLGNIGGSAAIPVMDGKSLLFKEFAGIDAFPICLNTQDADEIVNIAASIAPVFGGINLEDIVAPKCFEIERKLQKRVNIPVFHDDQHGTAIVVSAAIINSVKLLGKTLTSMKTIINGAGAAGIAITKMLFNLGIQDIIVCDRKGIISKTRTDLNNEKQMLANISNSNNISGTLETAVKGRDLFIGVSTAGILTQDMVKKMGTDPVIFALANPEPEILPSLAYEAGAAVVGTGRSDYPNQINNVLVFPGMFKGALTAKASKITEEMKIAAAYALAGIIKEKDLNKNNVIPSAFHPGVADIVANAVAKEWLRDVSS
ncbi:MAG: NAD(P)-dependent malic enzyme [Lentihominibacter sp.]